MTSRSSTCQLRRHAKAAPPPAPCPPGQRDGDVLLHPGQQRGLAAVPGGQAGHLLANVRFAQAGTSQNSHRTCSRITTRRPPTGASASRRSYRLCTRREARSHDGQVASPARARARMHSNPPASPASSYNGPGQVRQQHLETVAALA